MRSLLVVSAAVLLASNTVFAQEASEAVKNQCRAMADGQARSIIAQKKSNPKSLETSSQRGTSVNEQVRQYMIDAANRSSSMTESELASLGASYCVSRRASEHK